MVGVIHRTHYPHLLNVKSMKKNKLNLRKIELKSFRIKTTFNVVGQGEASAVTSSTPYHSIITCRA